MKFLMIVLAIHTIVEMISNKRKNAEQNMADEMNEKVLHPAEFMLR
ncbi:MAG: hypothetical protein JNM19_03145 [Chitinophagaceae bacterium]|nr:hypothetical protein [Chitinophagaceae bacterium]